MEEPKKYPFCGSDAEVLCIDENGYYVECGLHNGRCVVIPGTWFYPTKEKAIEAWNKRSE